MTIAEILGTARDAQIKRVFAVTLTSPVPLRRFDVRSLGERPRRSVAVAIAFARRLNCPHMRSPLLRSDRRDACGGSQAFPGRA